MYEIGHECTVKSSYDNDCKDFKQRLPSWKKEQVVFLSTDGLIFGQVFNSGQCCLVFSPLNKVTAELQDCVKRHWNDTSQYNSRVSVINKSLCEDDHDSRHYQIDY